MSHLITRTMFVRSSLIFLIMLQVTMLHRIVATENDQELITESDRQLRHRPKHHHHRDDNDNNDDSDNKDDGGSSKGFKLKMYWEPSYYWQESHRETFWCMQCRNNECRSGKNVQIRDCRGVNTRFEFVGSGAIQIKVSGTDLCMTMVGGDELQLKSCNSGDNNQKFNAGQGDFNSKRFEIYSVSKNGCIANPHHPRDKEIPFNQNQCVNPRDSRVRTSYWVKY